MPVARSLRVASAGGSAAAAVVPPSTQPYLAGYTDYSSVGYLYATRLSTSGTTVEAWYSPPAGTPTTKYRARWATGAQWLAYASAGGTLTTAKRSANALVTSSTVTTGEHSYSYGDIAISPDNRVLAAVDASGGCRFYSTDPLSGAIAGGSPKSNLSVPSIYTTAMAWNPSSDCLVVGSGTVGGSYQPFMYAFIGSPETGVYTSYGAVVPSGVYCQRFVWVTDTIGFVGSGTALYAATRSGNTITVSATAAATGIGSSQISGLAVTPDKTRLAATGSNTLSLYSISGTTLTVLTNLNIGSLQGNVTWAPGGSALYYNASIYVSTDTNGVNTYRSGTYYMARQGGTGNLTGDPVEVPPPSSTAHVGYIAAAP